MKDDLSLYILVVVFAGAGAVATAAVWQLFAATALPSISGQYAVLACVLIGLLGPVLVWLGVLYGSRGSDEVLRTAIRRPAAVGLGLASATELAFYVPIGFLSVAFHG